jgi:hypothetical protein
LDGKSELEKTVMLQNLQKYYNEHFECNKEPLPYSSLNELKKNELENFFWVKYSNFKKRKIYMKLL